MCKSTLKEEDIFFGIVENDGKRSSIIKRQPTLQELEVLWKERPDLFAGTCECGCKNYIYDHMLTLREDSPNVVAASYVTFYCPNCKKRATKGANYQISKLRIAELNKLL